MDRWKIVSLLSSVSFSILALVGCATNHSTVKSSSNSVEMNGATKNVISSQSHKALNHITTAPNRTRTSAPSSSQIHQTSYENASKAAMEISEIQRTNAYLPFNSTKFPKVNLGLGITAKQSGGLDHRGVQWREGNWIVEVLWFAGNQGGKQRAKAMVSYLHTHMLPARHNQGVVIVNSTKPNSKTIHANSIIAWQEGHTVYQVRQSGNPIHALTTVVNGKSLYYVTDNSTDLTMSATTGNRTSG